MTLQPDSSPARAASAARADEVAARASAELRGRYLAYRRQQARALLGMMPRDAVRPLYRRAVRGTTGEPDSIDPLEALVSYCESLLPLPPFGTWREDLCAHPVAHLDDLGEAPEAPTSEAPMTAETRSFDHAGCAWLAHLRVYRDDAAWRGFIAFEAEDPAELHHTAPIFRESDPTEVRERFLDFESTTLAAFLRSALP